MGANVIAKDFMVKVDVIDEKYTKLILKFHFAISRYMTERLSKEPAHSRDTHLPTRMMNCLLDSYLGDINEGVEAVVDMAYTHITANNRLSERMRNPTDAEKQVKNLEDLIGVDNKYMKKIRAKFQEKTAGIEKDNLAKAKKKAENNYSSDSAADSSDSS
jgi:hypothetical protein